MSPHGRIYPVDGLLSAFNLFMAGVWVTGLGTRGYASVLIVAHIAAAALPWLLRRLEKGSRPVWTLRRLYPMVWLLAFWTEIDLIRRQLHGGAHDAVVLALEDALFGVHLHEIWMPSMHALWFSEVMYFWYFAYYLALVLPVLWLITHRSDAILMDALFRLMATLSLCFVLFTLWPVDGPHSTGALFQGANARGVLHRLVDFVAVKHGRSLGAAFPSSHVAAAFTAAWVARLYMPRWVFGILALEAVGVFFSTFYTQQHYAIDAVAGVLVAVVVQALVVPGVLASRRRDDHRNPAVPPLPQPALFRAPGGRSP